MARRPVKPKPAAAAQTASQPVSWRTNSVIALALLAVTFCLYARTLGNDFIWYDDNEYVTANPHVQQGLTWDNIAWAFTTTSVANWHPVTWLSHMLDVQLWNLNPAGHHLTSVLLHACNAALLFGLLLTMTGSRWRSALVAALFAVHPLHVESVAWIAERKDVLSTFFGLLAIWAYVKYARSPRLGRYLLTLVLFALSLMSKPMLVTLPCVLLLLDVWPLKRINLQGAGQKGANSIWPRVLEKLPLLALSAASSVMTLVAQRAGHAVVPIEALSVGQRMVNALVGYASYLWKMIWPFDLAVLYPMPRGWSTWQVIVSALTLAIISAIAMVRVRTRPALLIGWLLYLGTLVPVIGLVQVGFQSMADRYTYVPLIGAFIMIAWAIPEHTTAGRHKTAAVATIAALVISALSIRTAHQIGYWRNSFTLLSHTINVTDNNFIAHNNLGYAYSQAGDIQRAAEHYAAAINIQPRYGVGHMNLGALYVDLQQTDQALAHLRRAVELMPNSSRAYNNLGAGLVAAGQVDQGIDAYRRAIELDPTSAEAHFNLGRALASQRRMEEAIACYRRALEHRPAFAQAHANWGIALATLNRLDEAIEHFQMALRINPDDAQTREFLAMAQQQKRESAGK